jgi:hypothetical protein
MRSETKDPDETLDYPIDWADFLGSDTISTSAWTAAAGITVSSESSTNTTTTAFFSGGTAGISYLVTNRITTAGGRSVDRSFLLRVIDK